MYREIGVAKFEPDNEILFIRTHKETPTFKWGEELCPLDVVIIAVETETDHVHVLCKLKPTQTVSSVLHRFKGGSAHRIFREFPRAHSMNGWK